MSDISTTTSLVPVSFLAKDQREVSIKCWLNNEINGMKFNYMRPDTLDAGFIVWFFADVTMYRHIDKFIEEAKLDLDKIDPKKPIDLIPRAE